ncbi:hypothetical protein F4560_003371 [Saccharothrix ecbatanensis]|uniref:Uncharacterized protein n=1 Tax=Saccharothrix ecbatanensis TaxID=1105145 RepID=A0A7W9HKH9_9PSEU|nr:hypothetical protein [Saccharothrix ecbatanensis]MBB5803603.1 hypothetical protein [Saccharothrix ecbatanensis]
MAVLAGAHGVLEGTEGVTVPLGGALRQAGATRAMQVPAIAALGTEADELITAPDATAAVVRGALA